MKVNPGETNVMMFEGSKNKVECDIHKSEAKDVCKDRAMWRGSAPDVRKERQRSARCGSGVAGITGQLARAQAQVRAHPRQGFTTFELITAGYEKILERRLTITYLYVTERPTVTPNDRWSKPKDTNEAVEQQ
ncbi:hypothetical protein EVAR_57993_1 [Eumeta japonica]|uniref:Uncharacterized protein n=1 Tax=Eumeta variegata TaxID=151549 RepID=A0A4C1YCM6_EUMVA|nr:hypothetical protein EVAR_57993_1 [Eumeta japonica]